MQLHGMQPYFPIFELIADVFYIKSDFFGTYIAEEVVDDIAVIDRGFFVGPDRRALCQYVSFFRNNYLSVQLKFHIPKIAHAEVIYLGHEQNPNAAFESFYMIMFLDRAFQLVITVNKQKVFAAEILLNRTANEAVNVSVFFFFNVE